MDIEKIPLIAGHPALDFVNTVEGRGTGTELNYLPDYRSLLSWSVRAGLIPASSGRALARAAAKHPSAARQEWARAMALKECLNRIVRSVAESESPPPRVAAEFNALLTQALANRRLEFSPGKAIDWTWSPRKAPAAALETIIWEIVLSAATLLADGARTKLIKICANGPCDWVFLDTSRSGHRRWCRMAVCGNALSSSAAR